MAICNQCSGVLELGGHHDKCPIGEAYEAGRKAVLDELQAVNRLTVIDHRTGGQGVIFEDFNVKVEILPLQDDGRTLKIRVIEAIGDSDE